MINPDAFENVISPLKNNQFTKKKAKLILWHELITEIKVIAGTLSVTAGKRLCESDAIFVSITEDDFIFQNLSFGFNDKNISCNPLLKGAYFQKR